MKHLRAAKAGAEGAGWLQELSRPRPHLFAAALALDWLAISTGIFLFFYFRNAYSFLAGSVLVGAGQHGLVVLGHEAVHYRICTNKKLNDFFGNLFCFMPIGLSVSSYRAFHLPHHRDPFGETDPEIPLRNAIGKSFAPPFSMKRGMKLWAFSYLGGSLKEMHCLSTMMPRSSAPERVGLTLFWISAAAISYRFFPAVFGLWFFSLSTTYISKLRIQAWFEHGLDSADTNRYALPNALYRFLMPHNIWVHYEHHKYPGIPFYNLEIARAQEAEPRIYEIPEMCEELNRGPSFYGKKAA